MARTIHKEPQKSKKSESDAHKVRRSFKEELELLKDLDEEELEEYDYTPPKSTRKLSDRR